MSTSITLLNASYEPHGRVDFKHAVGMLFRGVAEVVEAEDGKMIGPHPWPRVLRLIRYVKTTWMYRPAPYARTSLLLRDRKVCGYCGGKATTVDHIIPRSRGGDWSWLNNVAACGTCNHRKADRTPEEAGMRLMVTPWVPTRAEIAARRG